MHFSLVFHLLMYPFFIAESKYMHFFLLNFKGSSFLQFWGKITTWNISLSQERDPKTASALYEI